MTLSRIGFDANIDVTREISRSNYSELVAGGKRIVAVESGFLAIKRTIKLLTLGHTPKGRAFVVNVPIMAEHNGIAEKPSVDRK